MRSGLSLRQMEALYWVARLGSFSEAAAQLNTTQPAISNRIRELEAQLQLQLFSRGRGVSLTPAGRELLDVAERFVELGDEFLSRARAGREITGVLRIGAADTVALTILPQLVAELSRRFPRLDVELFVDLSVSIQGKLAEGDLDVGFLVGTAPGPEFVQVPLGSVENAWMASPRLGLSGQPVTPAELAAHAILTHTKGSHLHRTVKRWFAEAGVRRLRVHGCSSLATMVEMTVAGLGASVLPRVMMAERLARGDLALVEVGPPLPATAFSCVYADRSPTALYAAAVEIALREAARHPSFAPG